ncbi:MAG: hypothetical protein U0228_29215 [Myxococcaceae bacterium]
MRWLLVVPLLTLLACVSPLKALQHEEPLAFEGARFTLKSDGFHEADAKTIARAIERAQPELARWGALDAPVTVYVVPTHDALTSAVGRSWDWLRAWSQYDNVIFQAPSTWASRPEQVNELVLHELTHCLLFQRSADAQTWETRRIPLWFREGMAVYTARQAHLYPSLEDTSRFLEQGGPDPFVDGETLSRERSAEVYGVALHAFTFLVDGAGDESVRAVMREMRSGKSFDEAFQAAMSRPVDAFVAEFRLWLKRRSFRKMHKTVPDAQVPDPA